MNYELAKELKGAGFPQNFDFAEQVGNTMYPDVHFPTLSELIEACGEEFSSLHRANTSQSSNWCAEAFFDTDEHDEPCGGQIGLAQTPEEAVAKLWLTLNK